MFIDKVKIYVKAGNGGNGCVSFHREKYVSHGGPDGGDGGKGGNIVLRIESGSNTLFAYKNRKKFIAGNGADGMTGKKHGATAEDLVLPVPAGTVVRDAQSGQIIKDMSDCDDFILCKGGKGGWGNRHFATPVRQAPRFAKNGLDGEAKELILELKMLADVGLIGFPSVGKSSILARISSAKPKIADYHFTTLVPNLGVVDLGPERGFVMADIPGIIEGASEGVGLGFDFLRHIERTRVLIHVIDAASVEDRDPIEDIKVINSELKTYNEELADRPMVIAANKLDILSEEDREAVIAKLHEAFPDVAVYPISAATGEGVRDLLNAVYELLQAIPKDNMVFESEMDIEELKDSPELPIYCSKSTDLKDTYLVEGPRVERMLGYTNLEDEKGFLFFQNFMKKNGILDELVSLGMKEGDTVNVYGHEFVYYE